MADISIAEMLAGFGITDSGSQQTALAALVAAGVVSARPNRLRIAADKRDRVGAVLSEAFLHHCRNGDCRQQAAGAGDPRGLLVVDQPFCEMCGGSTNRSALERMAKTMKTAGVGRVLVVGGTEAQAREIRENSPDSVEWRFVNTQTSRDARYYRGDRDWADVIVIWASTPLPHKVSHHFEGKGDSRRVAVTRRGVAALADEVRQHMER